MSKNHGRLAVALGLAILLPVRPATGQLERLADDYAYTQWTTQQGLPTNVVRALAQTPDGFLWVGTLSGLARFDGVEFDVFDLTNTPELGAALVLTLHVGPTGTLWIGTQGGGVTSYHDGEFERITGTEPGHVIAMAEDRKGNAWLGGHHGLFRVRDGVVESVPPIDHRVVSLLVDPEDRLWVAASRDTTPDLRVSRATEIYRLVDREIDLSLRLENTSKGVLWLDHLDRVLLGAPNGITILSEGAPRRVELPDSMATQVQELNPRHEFYDGRLWLALSSGLSHAAPEDLDARRLRGSAPVIGTEVTSRVNTLHADDHGGLWVGTEMQGLLRLRRRLAVPWTTPPAWSSEPIVLEQLTPGSRWVLGEMQPEEPAPIVLRTLDGTIVQRIDRLPSGFAIRPRASPARDGGVWIAHVQGLSKWSEGGLAAIPIPEDLPEPYEAVFEQRDGTLWWTGESTVTRITQPGLGETLPGKILIEASDGSLWLNDYPRLLRYLDGELREWTVEEGAPKAVVRMIVEDDEGRLWLSSRGSGLGCFVDGRFYNVATEQGLADNILAGMLEHDGWLWINSNRGIFAARIDDLVEVMEGRSRYVACRLVHNLESRGPWAARGDDGRLYFHSFSGIVAVDPRVLPPVPAPSVAHITGIVAYNVDYDRAEEVVLPAGVRNVAIQYTAPNLFNPPAAQFRYRLGGIDTDWTYAGTRKEAHYTRVPPGRHRFEVVAGNTDLVWNGAGDALDLYIPPFLHERWWFRIAVLLVIVGSVTAAVRARARGQREHLEAVEKEADLRRRAEATLRVLGQRLMSAQEDERRRIAAELHDDINQRLAMLTVELQVRSGQPDGELGDLVEATQALASDVHRISHALHPARIEQLGLPAALRNLCGETEIPGEREITFEVRGEPSDLSPKLSVALYRIAQEALHNALKYSSSPWVTVRLTQKPREILLDVVDGGVGFDPDGVNGMGLGLATMTERARAFGGKLQIKSGPNEGSRIRARIPLVR